MTSTAAREADVTVVGAGFSGLAAARVLTAAGVDTIVLEARNRVGGRTENRFVGDGVRVDVGGTWIGPTQTRMTELAREFGLATTLQYDVGHRLLELEGRVRRYKGTIPRISPLTLVDLARMQLGAARAARSVASPGPRYDRRAPRFDAITLDDWLRGRRLGKRARTLLGVAGKTIWGAEPSDLSALFVLHYINSSGGMDALLDTEGGAQHERFEDGAQELAVRMADELGERVLLEAPVERIETDDRGGTVHTAGFSVRARRVIVALSPPLCERIEFDPPLPEARRQIQRRLRMGAITKCFALYDEPFWRHDGLSGEAVSDTGPATLTFDVSPPDASCGVLLGFVGGSEQRTLGAMDDAASRSAVLSGFARLYGPRALKAEGWIQRNWNNEQWSGGGPTAVAPPGVLAEFGAALTEPCGPILWAGTEAAERWGGYIEGAVVAGERAANLALRDL